MLLREFMSEPDLAAYSVMIIDEAHEVREVPIACLLTGNCPLPRVIRPCHTQQRSSG